MSEKTYNSSNCVSCSWFCAAEIQEDGDNLGTCRRLPPKITVCDDQMFSLFPEVLSSEWCAEYMNKHKD